MREREREGLGFIFQALGFTRVPFRTLKKCLSRVLQWYVLSLFLRGYFKCPMFYKELYTVIRVQ